MKKLKACRIDLYIHRDLYIHLPQSKTVYMSIYGCKYIDDYTQTHMGKERVQKDSSIFSAIKIILKIPIT